MHFFIKGKKPKTYWTIDGFSQGDSAGKDVGKKAHTSLFNEKNICARAIPLSFALLMIRQHTNRYRQTDNRLAARFVHHVR